MLRSIPVFAIVLLVAACGESPRKSGPIVESDPFSADASEGGDAGTMGASDLGDRVDARARSDASGSDGTDEFDLGAPADFGSTRDSSLADVGGDDFGGRDQGAPDANAPVDMSISTDSGSAPDDGLLEMGSTPDVSSPPDASLVDMFGPPDMPPTDMPSDSGGDAGLVDLGGQEMGAPDIGPPDVGPAYGEPCPTSDNDPFPGACNPIDNTGCFNRDCIVALQIVGPDVVVSSTCTDDPKYNLPEGANCSGTADRCAPTLFCISFEGTCKRLCSMDTGEGCYPGEFCKRPSSTWTRLGYCSDSC